MINKLGQHTSQVGFIQYNDVIETLLAHGSDPSWPGNHAGALSGADEGYVPIQQNSVS
jgi:hypothetical protein